MSPEQAAGRLDLLGPASDVYSLGATLYTLLTGRVPIQGDDLQDVLRKVERGEFARPRESAPWLDPAMDAICLKAMALRPEDRYGSPKALAEDIERWLADEPVAAHRESWGRKSRRWARKHRTAVTTTASTALVAAVLVGAFARALLDRARRADAAGLASLAKVEFLEAEARKADDPARWSEAIAEARRAEAQLESGGGGAAARSRAGSKLAELQEALRVVERDRAMLAALDEARLTGANVKQGGFDAGAQAEAIFAAFRAYEIDPATLPPEEAASRIRSSRIAADLIIALDGAAPFAAEDRRGRVAAVLGLADTDPRAVDIRERMARKDFDGLRRLVADEAGRRALGARCRAIFKTLAELDPSASIPVLEAIHREDRADFWLTHDLARACEQAQPPRLEAAIRYYHGAIALKPSSPGVFLNLGNALGAHEEHAAAIAAYREAIRLQPGYAMAHINLGLALRRRKQFDAAIAEYREAIRLLPEYDYAHLVLGIALASRRQYDAAITAFREVIRLKPGLAEAHYDLGRALNFAGRHEEAIIAYRGAVRLRPDATTHAGLGDALRARGDIDAAIAEYRESIRLQPDTPMAHNNLGNALMARGEYDAAIAACLEALRLQPDLPQAHCSLGLAYRRKGFFVESLQSLERGHELGAGRPAWGHPSAKWVREGRQLAALEARLPTLIKDEAIPVQPDEWANLVLLCHGRKFFAAAARFYDRAFAQRPQLAEDLRNGHRYNAACDAALAGSGMGRDDPPPDGEAQLRLRGQALAWLRADLAFRRMGINLADADALRMQTLQVAHWKVDPDVAGIREEAALAKLPEAERVALRAFWADVDSFLKEIAGG